MPRTIGRDAKCEKRDQPRGVQRRAVREAQRQRAAVLRAALSSHPCPQRAGRHREHLLDRGVELPHALEPRRERDPGDRHRGRLEQEASGLRALGAREGAADARLLEDWLERCGAEDLQLGVLE